MRRIILVVTCIIVFAGAFINFSVLRDRERRNGEGERENGRNDAMDALEFWSRSRAYPDNDIPPAKYYKAYQLSKTKHKELPTVFTAGSIWDPIGPSNLQGRCLCVAVNPLNSKSIYVGTASGGLWHSVTGGLGGDWYQIKLGYPALGISSILIDPVDTNKIYLGTGEVYGYRFSNGGVTLRTMRGSYGIGILKTIDGGTTWTKSLDWTYNQQRGVEMLKFNPLNRHTIWAATSEGLYKSLNEGATWQLISNILLGEDIIISPLDTSKMLVSFGDLNSEGTGVYATLNGGNYFYQVGLPGYTGKTLLCMYAANPNRVYASIADSTTGVGSLWMSPDFGDSWQMLSNYNNPSYEVQGWYSHYVAVKPNDSMIVVHNTARIGSSTDGGSTFSYWYTTTTNGNGYADNHGYAIDPNDPNILYAANDNGIYRSTDFGQNYTNIGVGMQTGQFFNGFSCSSTDSLIALGQSQDHIPGYRYLGAMSWDHGSASDEAGWTAINPSNDNIMFAVSRYGQSIVRSTDRGATFSTVANFSGNGSWNSPIVISPSNPQIVYFSDNYVRKSTNGGSTWTTTNNGNPLDANPTLPMAVAPTNSDTVYVGTAPVYDRSHIYVTANGGTSWTDITGSLPDRYPMDLAVDPTNSRIVYLAMGGFGSGHLFKSTDAGTSWNDISGTLPDAPTTAIAIDPLHPSNIYVGDDIGVYTSTNGGTSWASFNAGLPDAVIVADLTISPSNRALRVATHGNGVWERRLLGELPANYFDYKVASVDNPGDETADTLGTAISPFRATIRSLSIQSQTDSFDVKLRIIKGSIETFSTVKRFAGMASGETRQISFNTPYTPPEAGEYLVQTILLASDQNTSNDTAIVEFAVFGPPTIPYLTVTKQYSPYTEITGGSAGPSGDDVQSNAGIPFQFFYDNYLYDSVKISTNGWLELGTGVAGRFRGLSTGAELGGYFTASLATKARPSKAIGPWWTDMSTFGAGSSITYATTGTAPYRVFVVQWKNIPAYYDAGTTSILLNFQVKLYESTNITEICYGPVTPGSNPAVPQGASMGFKDYLGGDYRYYDLARRASGTTADLRSDLSPLTDWPGQDSSFSIQWNISAVSFSLMNGWNLVSLPLFEESQLPASIFPNFIAGTLFTYDNSYKRTDTLVYGKGYWIKYSSSFPHLLLGGALSTASVSLKAGWNIIGSVDHEVPALSGGIISSYAYGYGPTGYTMSPTLEPGQGYWIKSSAVGVISLGPAAQPKPNIEASNAACTITIADKLGRKQTLYLAENIENKINLERYEMPPLPPGGIFDARFSSQRILEAFPAHLSGSMQYPVVLQSAAYPLTITYRSKGNSGKSFSIEEISSASIVKSHNLPGDGEIVIAARTGGSLQIRVSTGSQTPTQFALKQNYPNPFNPATAIGFDVPGKSHVSLVIYDILGKEVKTLAEGEYDAGSYTVNADFSNLASGIYLYRLTSGSFTDAKKLVVIK
jgi:photosystem II stability/assembly factor-like uncharacterized protein